LEKSQLIHVVYGIRIRAFDTRIYNYYYFGKPEEEYINVKDANIKKAKIPHFKGRRRDEFALHFNLNENQKP